MFAFLKKASEVTIFAPISGRIIDLSQVQDEVFSKRMVGDGIAIVPSDNVLVAPCDGKITQIFSTNHALGIQTPEGLEILIHMGLDTVELKGKGFTRLKEVGSEIKCGDPIMEFNIQEVEKLGKSTITPVVITNPDKVSSLKKGEGPVEAGISVVMSVKVKASGA